MDKIFWLIPGKLGGRAGPVAEPWVPAKLVQAGVTVVVSTDDQCDRSVILSGGMKHLVHYMPTAYPANAAMVARFAGLVREAAVDVLAAIRSGETVLVHCYAGRDRTGLVLCAVLMELEGLTAKKALARVRAVRPMALTGPGVVDVLVEYEIRYCR